MSSQEHLPSRCLSTLASKLLQRCHHGSVWGAYFNAVNKFLFLYIPQRSFAYETHGIQFPLLVSTGNQQEEQSRRSCRSQFLKKNLIELEKEIIVFAFGRNCCYGGTTHMNNQQLELWSRLYLITLTTKLAAILITVNQRKIESKRHFFRFYYLLQSSVGFLLHL